MAGCAQSPSGHAVAVGVGRPGSVPSAESTLLRADRTHRTTPLSEPVAPEGPLGQPGGAEPQRSTAPVQPRRHWQAEPLEVSLWPGGGDPLNGELWEQAPTASPSPGPDRAAPESSARPSATSTDSSAPPTEPSRSGTATGDPDVEPSGPAETVGRAPAPQPPPWPLPIDEGPRRLPPEVIRYVVRNNAGRFRGCYAGGLLRRPELAGRVVIRFVIGRDGIVHTADGAGSQLGDPQVVSCIVEAFRQLAFPPPDESEIAVTYPLRLTPRRRH